MKKSDLEVELEKLRKEAIYEAEKEMLRELEESLKNIKEDNNG